MSKRKDRLNFDSPGGKFTFLTEAYIKKNYVQLTPHQSLKLRGLLPKGIYWIQVVERGLIHWNWTLLQDYLVRGDRPEHQALVEDYLASLNTAA
jgi:hypothetical protein